MRLRPQPIVRLEALRILLPLAILAFMSHRIAYADHWLSTAGFVVPDLATADWRQPFYLAPVSPWVAWTICGLMIASGLSLAAGFQTRWAAGLFAACLFYVAVADRLAAFTVSKLGPILVVALLVSPAGARFSVDAWRRRRTNPNTPLPDRVEGGYVLFFQLLLAVFYFSSGACKARGDWLSHSTVLWTHLHDSYQTPVSHLLANWLPTWSWTVLQWTTLAFEFFAPLWFGWRRTRMAALTYGVAMHAMIGVMFGPVIWFSLLMTCLLIACYAPERWLWSAFTRVSRV